MKFNKIILNFLSVSMIICFRLLLFFLKIRKYKKIYLKSYYTNCLLKKILNLKKYNELNILLTCIRICSVLVLFVLRKLFSHENNKSLFTLSSHIHIYLLYFNPKIYLARKLFIS